MVLVGDRTVASRRETAESSARTRKPEDPVAIVRPSEAARRPL